MNSNALKSLVRVTVPLALAGTLLAVPTSAQAAKKWHRVDAMHGAKAQACKERSGTGWRIYIRVDNRGGSHWHRAELGNNSGRKYVEVRTGAGRVSGVKSVWTTRGFSVGMGDANGDRGGWMPMSAVGRC